MSKRGKLIRKLNGEVSTYRASGGSLRFDESDSKVFEPSQHGSDHSRAPGYVKQIAIYPAINWERCEEQGPQRHRPTVSQVSSSEITFN